MLRINLKTLKRTKNDSNGSSDRRKRTFWLKFVKELINWKDLNLKEANYVIWAGKQFIDAKFKANWTWTQNHFSESYLVRKSNWGLIK